MERLDKAESRKRWAEIRKLWTEWDPIGVSSFGVTDEYDTYVGQTLRLLEQRTSPLELRNYLVNVLSDTMGLADSSVAHSSPAEFAHRLTAWYEANWPNTRV